MLRIFAALVLMLGLSACAGNRIDSFATSPQPKLNLESYFAGKRVNAYGIFEDRFGKLRREFKVVIDGRMEGDTLILDERFDYADGEKQRRIWRLRKTGADTYEGRADDVAGVATGKVSGNAFNFKYKIDLKVGDSTWRVTFDDWMFLQPDGVILNRAYVSRWGVQVGSVTLAFVPEKSAQ
jgi:hypothetical protein